MPFSCRTSPFASFREPKKHLMPRLAQNCAARSVLTQRLRSHTAAPCPLLPAVDQKHLMPHLTARRKADGGGAAASPASGVQGGERGASGAGEGPEAEGDGDRAAAPRSAQKERGKKGRKRKSGEHREGQGEARKAPKKQRGDTPGAGGGGGGGGEERRGALGDGTEQGRGQGRQGEQQQQQRTAEEKGKSPMKRKHKSKKAGGEGREGEGEEGLPQMRVHVSLTKEAFSRLAGDQHWMKMTEEEGKGRWGACPLVHVRKSVSVCAFLRRYAFVRV